MKAFWKEFEETRDVQALADGLDAFLVEHAFYREAIPPTVLEQIAKEDVQLVAYEFFSST